jgi:hypothetical protein
MKTKKVQSQRAVSENRSFSTKSAIPTVNVSHSKLVPMAADKFAELPEVRSVTYLNGMIPSPGLGVFDVASYGRGYQFALGSVVAMAEGVDIFGKEAKEKPRRVVLVSGTSNEEQLKSRLKSAASMLGKKLQKTLSIVTRQTYNGRPLPNMATKAGCKSLDEVLGDDWDVTVIDDPEAFFSSAETVSAGFKCLIAWALEHKSRNRTVIFIFRNRSGQKRFVWMSNPAFDFVLKTSRNPKAANDKVVELLAQWKRAQHLCAEDARPFIARYCDDASGVKHWVREKVDMPDPRLNKAREMSREGLSAPAIAKKLGVDKSTVYRWIQA